MSDRAEIRKALVTGGAGGGAGAGCDGRAAPGYLGGMRALIKMARRVSPAGAPPAGRAFGPPRRRIG
ncbi:MAG: hypothetical protein ACJ786_31645 [Catenulispora sp.]